MKKFIAKLKTAWRVLTCKSFLVICANDQMEFNQIEQIHPTNVKCAIHIQNCSWYGVSPAWIKPDLIVREK